ALLHAEDEVADVDLVGLLHHQRAGDLAAVDVGAVGALEVDDDELAVLEDDAGVALGDVALRQDDVVALHAADGDLRLVEVEPALLAAFFGDCDREHVGTLQDRKRHPSGTTRRFARPPRARWKRAQTLLILVHSGQAMGRPAAPRSYRRVPAGARGPAGRGSAASPPRSSSHARSGPPQMAAMPITASAAMASAITHSCQREAPGTAPR